MPDTAPEVSTPMSAGAKGWASLGDGTPVAATAAANDATDAAARNLNGIRVLDKAPRGRIAGECAVERDGGNGGVAPARAIHRVTDASGEGGSGWSLQTLDHRRSDTASSEGSEVISQFD